ncbi:hypothetical protein I5U73_17705, partial [Stenotrophomonas maltophilia]|nr:hypothetical protein [Stenotrophomonas maltophilia]
MDNMTLLVTVLSMVGVRLPVLIALCVGLVWVVGAPRAAPPPGARAGRGGFLVARHGREGAGGRPRGV